MRYGCSAWMIDASSQQKVLFERGPWSATDALGRRVRGCASYNVGMSIIRTVMRFRHRSFDSVPDMAKQHARRHQTAGIQEYSIRLDGPHIPPNVGTCRYVELRKPRVIQNLTRHRTNCTRSFERLNREVRLRKAPCFPSRDCSSSGSVKSLLGTA